MATTVLVADDDADIVRFVAMYLRLEGFAVVTARDGPDVLAKAVAVHPDLVLLDVRMPGLDGSTVCAQIRAEALLHLARRCRRRVAKWSRFPSRRLSELLKAINPGIADGVQRLW